MKRYLTLALSALALISCNKENDAVLKDVSVISDYFYAETPYEETKTFIDSEYSIYWVENDRISIFCSPTNEEYRYLGKTGEVSGSFENMSDPAIPSYGRNYSVYPYSSTSTSFSEGVIGVVLPATQNYGVNSFGYGANTMTAVTKGLSDKTLKFNNVCGYLMVKLYGGDRIKKVKFRGNNNEKIAGEAIISTAYGSAPAITMGEEATTEISLICPDEGVPTQTTEQSYSQFWIVIPPTSFSKGFTIEITNSDDDVISRSTSKEVTISRNKILKMSPVKVDNQNSNDILSFSLSDGTNSYKAFDISNGYVNIQVPGGTDMTKLVASFDYNGTSVSVNHSPQTSGVDAHDFSDFVNPVKYVVTAKNGNTKSYTIRMFNLPIIFASTPSAQQITSKTVWTEKCTFKIRDTDGTTIDCGETSIKGRGNSTWAWYAKKPYAVKFGKKISVLGMKAHKRWCLMTLNPGYHYSNSIGFELGKRTESLEWTSSQKYVELFLNGNHRGLYTLTEQIKIDKDRVNITEMTSFDTEGEAVTGGYLLTYDNTYDEVNKFRSQYFKMPIMFKDPDEDVLEKAQFDYLQNYVNNFEASLMDNGRFAVREYLNYFDIDSYIDMWFVWEMAGDTPCSIPGYSDFTGPRSVYFHKDRSSKIKAGPLWDFNESLYYRQYIICANCQYYGRLFQDPYFVARVKSKWPEFKARVKGEKGDFEGLVSVVDKIHDEIYNSSLRDWNMWWTKPRAEYKYVDTPDEQYTLIRNGIYPKLDFLESYINSLVEKYGDTNIGNSENYDDQQDNSDDFNFGF